MFPWFLKVYEMQKLILCIYIVEYVNMEILLLCIDCIKYTLYGDKIYVSDIKYKLKLSIYDINVI